MKYKLILITAILFFAAIFHAEAQENVLDERINVTISSSTISAYFSIIEKNGMALSYNSSYIDMKRICHLKEGYMTVRQMLKILLHDYDAEFHDDGGRKIIIVVKPAVKSLIRGKIYEKGSLEKLYGVIILCYRKGKIMASSITDDNGNYVLNLPQSEYDIEIRYLGYDTHREKIDIFCDLSKDFELQPVSLPLKEAKIVPKHGSSVELSGATPSNMLVFGSNDLFSEMKILPGIVSSGANSEIHVNGGGGDENLMLLDGIPILHPGHIVSNLPDFNGDIIKNVSFHKSFFPTQFEGRLSSVIDIKLKDGNKDKHGFTTSIDVPTASFMLEGPLVKGKCSYVTSFRSSWLDLFDKFRTPEKRTFFSFKDFNAKIHYDLTGKIALEAIAYSSNDNYYLPWNLYPENHGTRRVLYWNNQLYAIKVNSVIGSKIINTTTFSYTNYKNNAFAGLTESDSEGNISAIVKEYAAASHFSLSIDNIYKINFGFRGSYEVFHFDPVSDTLKDINLSIKQMSFFFDNEIHITSRLFANIGINYLLYLPKNNPHYNSIQPRVLLKYALGDKDILYMGISRMAQFYRYLKLEYMPMPTDLRMPTVKGYEPMTATHFEGGWKHFWSEGKLNVSFYYKKRNNIIALRPDVFPEDEEWGKYIMTGSGNSYGFQVYFFREWNRFSSQISYALSRSRERYSYMSAHDDFPSFYDIPHLLRCAFSYKITQNSIISAGGKVHTGRVKNINDLFLDGEEETFANFRKMRYPTAYRLDAGYTYVKQFRKIHGKMMFRIGLYNIVGNPTYEDFLDLYSIDLNRHCIPYGTISIRF